MRILANGGSNPDNPIESHEHIPHRGYGDGHGGYGTYGASPYGKGKGWWQEYGNEVGYGPRGLARSSYSQHYAGNYGAKGDGKGNVYIVQAPMGPGSEYIYPLKGDGKGKGKSKGKGGGADQEVADGYLQGSSRSPSATGRGWAARKARREASRPRSEARPATGPPGQHSSHWDLLNDSPAPASPSPVGTAPPRAKARPQRASVKHELEAEEDSPCDEPEECYTWISASDPVHESNPMESDDGKILIKNMEGIQIMIDAIRGRTDQYSNKCRQGMIQDLQQLRIRKTQLKPLGDQQSILEALVEKRKTHFKAAEQLVHTSIAKMESAKEALEIAQQQLFQVQEQKHAADAINTAAEAEKQLPDNAKSLEKVKDLVCLLPTNMAGEFGQCLAMLENLLQQANKAAAEARVQEVPDSDSEMASDASPKTAPMEHLRIPLFPGGTERLHTEEECRKAFGDPYLLAEGATATGCTTPPRGRCRSAVPGRSPATRSRTPEGEIHGRQQDAAHFCRAEQVAAPFRG